MPPGVLVILDEAYIEFQTDEDPDTSLDLLRRFGNLVILRTFSKAYGLAGLRVGFALGSEEFKAAVDRVRQPFSVNHLAQAAATEALRHQDDVARRVEWNAAERLWMEEELAELGLDVADSQANFCWVSLGDRDERGGRGRAGARRRRGAARNRPGWSRAPARDVRHPRRERALRRGAARRALARRHRRGDNDGSRQHVVHSTAAAVEEYRQEAGEQRDRAEHHRPQPEQRLPRAKHAAVRRDARGSAAGGCPASARWWTRR